LGRQTRQYSFCFLIVAQTCRSQKKKGFLWKIEDERGSEGGIGGREPKIQRPLKNKSPSFLRTREPSTFLY
jgi:hypothetical protein